MSLCVRLLTIKQKELNFVIYENLNTKIQGQYDVIVCGGGVAGISAALASARQGKKVALLEREFALGGLATLGLISIYLPLCDGYGKQVSFGIAEELLKLSISITCEEHYPEKWFDKEKRKTINENDQRYLTRYNPQLFAILCEQLLLKEGVDILYGTYVVSVSKNNDFIDAVICETKQGRVAYKAKSFVDCTGDADVAFFSGAPTSTFKQGNLVASWYYHTGKNGYNLKTMGVCDVPDNQKEERGEVEKLSNKRYLGLDNEEISDLIFTSHKSLLNDFKMNFDKDNTLMPVTMATIPQLRMTRKIVGEYEISDDEMHKEFSDSVGLVSDWRKKGPVYEVPFSTLYSGKVKNLICAGRTTSCTEAMWDIMRVIPCCAVTGEAAGTAAAIADDFSNIDIKKLQKVLQDNNVVLHEKDIIE